LQDDPFVNPDDTNKTLAAAARGPISRAQFLSLFLAVMLPMFMAAADQTLLATATPVIAGSLGGLRDSSWIAVAYLLSAAVIVPVYGRLGDLRGKRSMLLVALGAFTFGSIVCAAAQTMPQLIVARVIQGVGGGGLMMLSHALIGELVPPVERVRFQGYFATMFAIASVAGPVIGGFVVTHVSWRWLFLANLPLALFAAWRLRKLPSGERHPELKGSVDFAGHVLFAVGALSALFWLTSGGHRFAWTSSMSAILFTTAVISLATLTWHERRHSSPFLPVALFGDRAVRLCAVLVTLFAACMFAIIFFLPIYLQLGHQVSPQVSGLLLLPVTAGQVTGNLVCTRILRRTGDPYPIPIAGMSFTTAGLLLLAVIPPTLASVGVLGFIAGLGLGTVMPITTMIVQMVAGRTKLAAATATVSLSRSTGGAAGAALFGAIVFSMIPEVDRQTIVQQASELDVHRVLRAFHWAFFCAALAAAAAVYTATRMPRIKLWQPSERKATSPAQAPRETP
jgi:EmrB/QacA subfamily drug resistance transporter